MKVPQLSDRECQDMGGATRTRGPGARFELASRDPQPPSITRLAHPGRESPNRGGEYSILLDLSATEPRRARVVSHTPHVGAQLAARHILEPRGALSKGNAVRHVHQIRREAEERIQRSGLVVILLGSSGRGLEERREVAHILARRGIVVLVPEDDFPMEIGPSVLEVDVLERSDVDLVFLSIESWGAATEFGQFSSNPKIAPKLRVLVRPEYHPVHSPAGSYLTDLYLTHLVRYGHVYPVDGGRRAPVPSAKALIPMLAERHREIKAFRPLSITK